MHIRGVSKKFGEWYQKTNKTEDTNKLTHRTPLIWCLRSIPKEAFADSFQKLYERLPTVCCEGWRLF
jgi:hypothetical protein